MRLVHSWLVTKLVRHMLLCTTIAVSFGVDIPLKGSPLCSLVLEVTPWTVSVVSFELLVHAAHLSWAVLQLLIWTLLHCGKLTGLPLLHVCDVMRHSRMVVSRNCTQFVHLMTPVCPAICCLLSDQPLPCLEYLT